MTLTFSGTSASVNSGSRSGSPSASRKSRRRFFAIDIAERFQRVADHEGSHIGGRVDPQYADHRQPRRVLRKCRDHRAEQEDKQSRNGSHSVTSWPV